MLYVASPDYSQLRTNYLKARDAYALAQKAYARAKDLYAASRHRRTESGAGRVRRGAGRRRPGRGRSCAEGHGHHRSRCAGQGAAFVRGAGARRRSTAKWSSRMLPSGSCFNRAPRSASWSPTSARSGCWSTSIRKTCPMCASAMRSPSRPIAYPDVFHGTHFLRGGLA